MAKDKEETTMEEREQKMLEELPLLVPND